MRCTTNDVDLMLHLFKNLPCGTRINRNEFQEVGLNDRVARAAISFIVNHGLLPIVADRVYGGYFVPCNAGEIDGELACLSSQINETYHRAVALEDMRRSRFGERSITLEPVGVLPLLADCIDIAGDLATTVVTTEGQLNSWIEKARLVIKRYSSLVGRDVTEQEAAAA